MKQHRLLIVFISILLVFAGGNYTATADDTTQPKLLTAGITMVPKGFYGTWRVSSTLLDTDSPVIFKEHNIDLWNLSRSGNVIKLSNPFNGAEADITVDKADQSYIVFKKTGKYGEKFLTDTVEIKLEGDTFKGIDTLKLDTHSDIDGRIIKTEIAKYSIRGEKIAGKCTVEE